MIVMRTIAATVAVAVTLLGSSTLAQPGASTLHRLVIHEVIPREPSVGGMSHDVALGHLRSKGYSPKSKLRYVNHTWVMVDVKTGHRVRIDAVSGIVVETKR
jgi:hypothetical protein